MARKRKTFRVESFIKAWTEIEITADSLEQAVEIARTLKVEDFVSFSGERIDDSLQILGVSAGDIPDVNG